MSKPVLSGSKNTDDSNSQKLNSGNKNTEKGVQNGPLFIWDKFVRRRLYKSNKTLFKICILQV